MMCPFAVKIWWWAVASDVAWGCWWLCWVCCCMWWWMCDITGGVWVLFEPSSIVSVLISIDSFFGSMMVNVAVPLPFEWWCCWCCKWGLFIGFKLHTLMCCERCIWRLFSLLHCNRFGWFRSGCLDLRCCKLLEGRSQILWTVSGCQLTRMRATLFET